LADLASGLVDAAKAAKTFVCSFTRRSPEGRVFYLAFESLKQIDLSDDEVVGAIASSPWETGMQPVEVSLSQAYNIIMSYHHGHQSATAPGGRACSQWRWVCCRHTLNHTTMLIIIMQQQ
jgi:hypothetical protein